MMNQEHRAAICLNNTGIALLQRRCFHQGLRTLSDAVTVMNAVCKRMKDSTSMEELSRPSSTSQCTEIKLQQAAQRLSKPEPSSSSSCSGGSSEIQVEILSDDQSPSVLDKCFSSPPTQRQDLQDCQSNSTNEPQDAPSYQLLLLRIEDYDYEIHSSYDIHSSIMLHNFGLAYRCLASQVSDEDSETKDELQNTAMRLFHLSYSILCVSWDKSCSDEMDAQRFTLAAILVLENLTELTTELGMNCHAREYNKRLECLRERAAEDIEVEGCVKIAAEAA